jgi:Family of unknown function (DUF6279)
MKPHLFSPTLRRSIIGIGLSALVLAGGCSAFKLGYGQGPTLAHWWLDGYVDFDSQQSERVREELRRWFAWHQQSELAGYAQHLSKFRNEAAERVSPEKLCRWTDATRDLLVPALERTLPAAADLVLTLTPAQLDRIQARYQERTDKLRSELVPADPAERHRASVERMVKRYEDFYGRLSAEQRQMIDAGVRAAPVDSAAALERRHKRHTDMMAELRSIVRDRPATAQVQERLRLMLQRFDGRSPVEPVAQAKAMASANCDLAARIHNSATSQQRQALSDKLKSWETDLRTLANNNAALAQAAPPVLSVR